MATAGGRGEPWRMRARDGGGSASNLPPPDLGMPALAPHRGAAGQPAPTRAATAGCPTC